MSKIIHYSLNNPRLLPSGYTPLLYIESNGNLWFSTNIKPTSTTSFYIKCVWNSKSGWNMMFGCWGNCNIAVSSNSAIYVDGGDTGQNVTLGNIYEIYSTSSNSYLNSNTALTQKIKSQDSNLAIFGACSTNDSDKDWRNDGTRWGIGVGKVYNVRIWDNGIIKRDLYPAKNSSNTAGMFDLVELKFYTSATSTAFIAGPEVPIGLPAEYTPVEWIKTGSTTTTCTNAAITCYRNSDMMPGIYTKANATPFAAKSGYILGPTTRDEGREWNNSEIGGIDYNMLGTLYTASSKFTHTSSAKDGNYTLPVYLRVEPGQRISISFDTDVTLWASLHDTSGGTTNKGKWAMWIYFSKVFNPNSTGYDTPTCYPKSNLVSLGGTRWKYTFTIPAEMHMIRIRVNVYSDGSTSYTGHFWNFNWSFGDGGCLSIPTIALLSPSCKWSISQPDTPISPYDSNIYTEPDGTKWIRIFHHADPTTYKFASNNTFDQFFKIDDRRWWALPVCNEINGVWELMCKEKGTSSDTEKKFRWILFTNPMAGDFASTTSDKITRNTSSGYMTNGYGGLYKFNSNCYIVTNNGTNGNWFGAFGSWSSHDGGIPSFPGGSTIKDGGYKDLYLKLPNYNEGSTEFNGDNSEVILNNIPNIWNNPFSISFWLYSNDNNDRSIYFSNYNSSPYWAFEKSAANGFRLSWNGSPDLYSTYTCPNLQWCNVTLVRENTSTFKLYIDGELKHTYTGTFSNQTFNSIFRIGKDTRNGTTALNGNIKDFMIFDHALSRDEILQIM